MNILPDDPAWLHGKKYFSNKYYSRPLSNSREINQIIRETPCVSIYIYIYFSSRIRQKFVYPHSEYQQKLYRRRLIATFHRLARRYVENEANVSGNSLLFFRGLPRRGWQKRKHRLMKRTVPSLEGILVDVATVRGTCNPLLLQQPRNTFHDNVREPVSEFLRRDPV